MPVPKVLVVIADSSQTGAPAQVKYLVTSLKDRLDFICLCPSGYLADELKSIDVTVALMPAAGRIAQTASLAETIHKFQPNIVHAHGVRAGLIAGEVFRRPQTSQLIYTEHLWTADYFLKNPLRQFVQLYLLRRMAKKAKKVVAVSRAVADFLIAKRIVPKEKCQVIYNAIEPIEPVTPSAEPVIGTLGSLNKMKGTELILLAAHQLKTTYPNLKIRIMGDGPERTSLEKLSRELELKTELLGAGSSESLRPFFQSLRVYIQPSFSESFGLSTLEAMSAGLPVVVSRAGALSELVSDDDSGLTFKRGDPRSLSEALFRMLGDKALYERIRQRGLEVAGGFTLEKMSLQYYQLYQSLI